MQKIKNNKVIIGTTLAVGIFLGGSVIYFTPLKYAQLVEPQVRDIDAKTFNDDYQKNKDKYIFLDVRGVDAYNNIHAVGAKSQPLHTLYNERHSLPRNKDKEIVLICSGGVASGVGFSYLEHYGFRNIKRIHGGIEAWIEAGLPVDSQVSKIK